MSFSHTDFNKSIGLLVTAAAFGAGWSLKPAPPSEVAVVTEEPLAAEAGGPAPVLPVRKTDPIPAGADSAPGTNASSASRGASPSKRFLSGNLDIPALGRRITTSRDPVERRLAFAELLDRLTPENALEIRAQIADLDPSSREFQDFHYAWGKVAGTEAVLFGAQTPEPDMEAALGGWASANPVAAREWFSRLDIANNPHFDTLLRERGVPEGNIRNVLVKGLVQGLSNTDPGLAASFTYDLAANGDGQAKAMMRIVTSNVIRGMGLDEAIAWAQTLPGGRMQGAAAERVVQDWGKTDAISSLIWAADLGLERGGGPALSAAYAMWGAGAGGGDPVEASVALREMPTSLERDFAINGFISGLAHHDLPGAVTWTLEIASDPMRNAALTRILEPYLRRDPARVAELFQSGIIPENIQAMLTDLP